MLDNTSSAVGKEIRHQRRVAGLTLKEVAARIGVTGVQLHRYETGTTGITTSRLVAIAQALGIRADVLLNAATQSGQGVHGANRAVGPVSDLTMLLEVFMTIRDPSHRDALMSVARMMSASALPHATCGAEGVA